MDRERHLIITPDGTEKTVYSVCDQGLSNLLRITLLEIFSLKDIQSPKIKKFQSAINSPIKIIKNKSNNTLQTSVIVSMNEILFECKTQMPCDLHKQSSWKPLCEDMIEMNIVHSSFQNFNFSVFAIKNLIDNKHYYFTDIKTITKIKELSFIISCFLEENYIKKSFTKIYKKVMSNDSTIDILESVEKFNFLKENMLFLMTCISEYQQPDMLLASFLKNKILPNTWLSGDLFFKEFSESINTSSDYIKESIIHTYDKYLLYLNLNNNLVSCKNKTKCVKL